MRNPARQLAGDQFPSALWFAGALGLTVFAVALAQLSGSFGYDWAVIDMPILTLTALLTTAGSIFFAAVWWAVHKARPAYVRHEVLVFVLMCAAGLLARLILFASEPALEDDYQRYLWDGAVAANGFNPYQSSPAEVAKGGATHPLAGLATQSGAVIDRINHQDLTTIYPPVAQVGFAIAYAIEPFSLLSWRSVVLAADIATLALVAALLGMIGKSRLWAVIYWWNPVVLKEFYNSAHMDVVLLPLVLGALYLALRMRPVAATVALACAAGVKIWPVLLVPLVWRQSVKSKRDLIVCLGTLVFICALWLWPYLIAGLGEKSGTLAYAERWTINAPLFTSLRAGLRAVLDTSGLFENTQMWASMSARALLGFAAVVTAVALALKPARDAHEFIRRALIVVAAIILLAPAIYPWYTLWMAPLLALVPELGLILLYATIPLYYTYFYFAARALTEVHHQGVVWIVWLPVWTYCLITWLHRQPIGSEKITAGRSGHAQTRIMN